MPPVDRTLPFSAFSFLLICLIVCTPACNRREEPIAAPPTAPTNNAVVPPELNKLVGRWLRPDGGYVLEVLRVNAGGQLVASYLNPKPINVHKALAFREGNTTKLFVELRDVNYPGSTYSLQYDPVADQLFGQYFQAAMRETYEVAFQRLKPGE